MRIRALHRTKKNYNMLKPYYWRMGGKVKRCLKEHSLYTSS